MIYDPNAPTHTVLVPRRVEAFVRAWPDQRPEAGVPALVASLLAGRRTRRNRIVELAPDALRILQVIAETMAYDCNLPAAHVDAAKNVLRQTSSALAAIS